MNRPSGDTSDLSLDELVRLQEVEDSHSADADHPGGPGHDDPDEHGEHGDDDGRAVVLPWWQHPLNIVTLIVAASLMAGIVGWMVGDSNQSNANDVDIGFLQDMREHHEQAVAMGLIFNSLDDTNPGLRAVSNSIVFGQSIEIGRMIQMLREIGADEANQTDSSMLWMGMSAAVGRMPGMASDAELDDLASSSGADADRLFVELMEAHHIGGIDMAEFAAANANVDEVTAMAASMAEGQRDEIGELRRLVD